MDFQKLERIVKGFANHRRIEILELLEKKPLSLSNISIILKINIKTASEHTRRLYLAGLIEKKYRGRAVLHSITDLGSDILTFLRKWE